MTDSLDDLIGPDPEEPERKPTFEEPTPAERRGRAPRSATSHKTAPTPTLRPTTASQHATTSRRPR